MENDFAFSFILWFYSLTFWLSHDIFTITKNKTVRFTGLLPSAFLWVLPCLITN